MLLCAVRLLADVTKQVAVVRYPSMVKSRVRHIELVLTPARLMVVLITDAGRMNNAPKLLRCIRAVLQALRAQLNTAMMSYRLPEVADRISGILESYD